MCVCVCVCVYVCVCVCEMKEEHVLFNDALSTLYLRLYGVGHMAKDHSDSERENPLQPYGLLVFRLAARVLLYRPSHRQDICYTSRGALAGTRNSLLGPP